MPEIDSIQVRVCERCGEPLLSRGHECKAPKEKRPAIEAWHRPLDNGRVEILCRAPGYHLRVSAKEEEAWEAVELFERWTGLEIQSERRPRRVKAPMPGSIAMFEMPSTDELESNANGTD